MAKACMRHGNAQPAAAKWMACRASALPACTYTTIHQVAWVASLLVVEVCLPITLQFSTSHARPITQNMIRTNITWKASQVRITLKLPHTSGSPVGQVGGRRLGQYSSSINSATHLMVAQTRGLPPDLPFDQTIARGEEAAPPFVDCFSGPWAWPWAEVLTSGGWLSHRYCTYPLQYRGAEIYVVKFLVPPVAEKYVWSIRFTSRFRWRLPPFTQIISYFMNPNLATVLRAKP